MNKERLQEIKDSIDFQREFLIASNMKTLCVDEEMELYNEIIRLQQENQQLKKQKDDVVDFIKIYRSYEKIDNKDYLKSRDEIGTLSVKQVDDLLRMLGEIDG